MLAQRVVQCLSVPQVSDGRPTRPPGRCLTTGALLPLGASKARLRQRVRPPPTQAVRSGRPTSRMGTALSALSVDAAPAVPRSIHDVDNGKLLGFGAELAEDHPGFLDEEYKKRRAWIASVAAQHGIGQPIPRISYTLDELRVWRLVLQQLRALFPTHACREFNRAFAQIGFKEDEIPQLQDLSELLHQSSGWQIRPVAGLMHPRDFLNGLAFKYFHSTQYVRHHSKPYYTPEPDVCHELLGHVPMLLDPEFGSLVQSIGTASLAASDKEIWHLTKVYWFTVEFGVVRETPDLQHASGNGMTGGNGSTLVNGSALGGSNHKDGSAIGNGSTRQSGLASGDGSVPVSTSGLKAFGAGILSSYGELQHMLSGLPTFERFDPFAPQPKMSYKDGYQKRYFVLDSFQGGAQLLKQYSATVVKADRQP